MAAMIYDRTAGAWRDAETPLVWDVETQAYKDSTGLIWDEQTGAWSERWDAREYLFKEGVGPTDGWTYTQYGSGSSEARRAELLHYKTIIGEKMLGVELSFSRTVHQHLYITIGDKMLKLYDDATVYARQELVYDITDFSGRLSFWTSSNPFYTVTRSSNVTTDCIYMYHAYYDGALTAYIYNIWIE